MNKDRVVLETSDDLVAALNDPDYNRKTMYEMRPRSQWLCALIREIKQTQYPYNQTIFEETCRRLNLPYKPQLGYDPHRPEDMPQASVLDTLIYYAQDYVREDEEKALYDERLAAGWLPFTQETLEQVARIKKRVVINGKPCKPKLVNDTWYAFAPHARNRAYLANSNKLVEIVA